MTDQATDQAPIVPQSYLPDDMAAINALQKRIDEYRGIKPYTPEEEKGIMRGRSSPEDRAEGLRLINERLQQSQQSPVPQLNVQLAALKKDAAERYLSAKKQGAVDQKNTDDETYHKGWLGKGMGTLEAVSPFLGVPVGTYVANKIANRQDIGETGRNTQRQSQASAFDRVNPDSPTARAEYQSIADTGEKLQPLNPEAAAKSRYKGYSGYGKFALAEGLAQRLIASQQDDPFKKDAWNASGAINMGGGATLMALGHTYANNPNITPDTDALRKIELAKQYAKDIAARPPKPTPPPRPSLPPFSGPPSAQAYEISRLLGLDPKAEPKAKIAKDALQAIPSADPEVVSHIASRIRNPASNDPVKAVSAYIAELAKKKPMLGLLATVGASAGLSTLSPDSAEAGEDGRRRDESLMHYRLRQAGSNLLSGVDTASYFTGLGEARMAYDAGSTAGDIAKRLPTRTPGMPDPSVTDPEYNPRSKAYSDAMAARRSAQPAPEPRMPHLPNQRNGLFDEAANAQPSEVGQNVDRRVGRGTVGGETSHQSAFVSPEQRSFNPDDLPEHERSLLYDPQQAHEQSRYLIPYLRAGASAHARGEDFFGGSPAYDRELAALKHFYGGAQAPTAPEAETAPEGYAKGGRVAPHHKKVHSISEAFKQRLDGKHKLIASLEKAHAKGAKVGDKLSKEREEAKRIAEHLEKIKNYA